MTIPDDPEPNWDKFFEQLWKISDQVKGLEVRIRRLTDPLEGLGYGGKKDEEDKADG